MQKNMVYLTSKYFKNDVLNIITPNESFDTNKDYSEIYDSNKYCETCEKFNTCFKNKTICPKIKIQNIYCEWIKEFNIDKKIKNFLDIL